MLTTVTLDAVRRTYRGFAGAEVVALREVRARFLPGSVSAIVGRSGSGKTTLIRLIAGLELPTSGSVRIGDQRVEELSTRQRLRLRRDCVSVVFQEESLIGDLTVEENLLLALRISGKRDGSMGIDGCLDELGLSGYHRHRVAVLSGGEQQRVAIARALLLEHPVLLADEPTGSLDDENAVQVSDALRAVAVRGAAVVVATHDDIVSSRADVVFRIERGALMPA